MSHKHTCLACGRVVGRGGRDCEYDRDHDFELCLACATREVQESAAELAEYLRRQAERRQSPA